MQMHYYMSSRMSRLLQFKVRFGTIIINYIWEAE